MKILLVIIISIAVVVLYTAFRLWLFFRRIVKPSNSNFSPNQNNVNNVPLDNQKSEVLYSNAEVVVLKGEAKDSKDKN